MREDKKDRRFGKGRSTLERHRNIRITPLGYKLLAELDAKEAALKQQKGKGKQDA
jgi:hypothetical protein